MKYLLHDKGNQFRQAFQDCINTTTNEEGVKMQSKPVGCPQMNSHCERVIQSIQNDCLNRVIIFGERMLRYALKQYQAHYNAERHHQGIGNVIPFPVDPSLKTDRGEMKCKTRLGGLLRSYYREAEAA